MGWAIVCHTLHQYPHPILQGCGICLRKIFHSMAISCPVHMSPLPPSSILVGPVLKLLGNYGKPFPLVVMDTYPRKYWWPIVTGKAVKARKLASMGDTDALLLPSKHGWVPHKRSILGDLWAFAVHF